MIMLPVNMLSLLDAEVHFCILCVCVHLCMCLPTRLIMPSPLWCWSGLWLLDQNQAPSLGCAHTHTVTCSTPKGLAGAHFQTRGYSAVPGKLGGSTAKLQEEKFLEAHFDRLRRGSDECFHHINGERRNKGMNTESL